MSSSQVSLIERRAHPRVIVELRCFSAGAKTRNVVARTVNISRTGVLMLWDMPAAADKLPRLGEVLKVDVELPAAGRGRKCIRCRGRVVRVHMAENRAPLVALAIAQMDFRDHEIPAMALERIEGGRQEHRKVFRGAMSS